MKIETIYADALYPEQVQTLLNWRDCTTETLVEGLTIGQLLKLYHASGEYISIEAWLLAEPKAPIEYKRIAKRSVWAPSESN